MSLYCLFCIFGHISNPKSKLMEYYLLIGGIKKGPLSFEDLIQNGLTKDVLVWHVGMTDWQKASDMAELRELLAKLPPPIPSGSSATFPAVPPKSWLVESILATLFCCLPFGIVGIVYACKVSSEFSAGHYEASLKASKDAGKWTKISFFTGLSYIAIILLLYCIAIIFSLGFLTDTPYFR